MRSEGMSFFKVAPGDVDVGVKVLWYHGQSLLLLAKRPEQGLEVWPHAS